MNLDATVLYDNADNTSYESTSDGIGSNNTVDIVFFVFGGVVKYRTVRTYVRVPYGSVTEVGFSAAPASRNNNETAT